MLAWEVHRPGPIGTGPLELVTRDVPEPGPGEVLLRVRACGVCRTDLHVAEGDLPYFGVAVRKELIDKDPDIAAKISKVFEECLAGINDDTAKAVDLFGEKTGVPSDILKEALGSKRLTFRFRPMTDPAARTSVVKASEFLARNGLLKGPIDDKFFSV